MALQFDGWTVDRVSGEISRDGRVARLPQQPLRILLELADHAGEVVTRDQLVKVLWPKGVVDFDNGLNVAMRKLRVALDDTGDAPKYIETLPKVGYRFIGKASVSAATPAAESPCAAACRRAHLHRWILAWWRLAARRRSSPRSCCGQSHKETRRHHVPSARAQELYVEGMHERSRRDIDATAAAHRRTRGGDQGRPVIRGCVGGLQPHPRRRRRAPTDHAGRGPAESTRRGGTGAGARSDASRMRT